jgi:hypothetical protein
MTNQIKYLRNLFYDLLNDYGRALVVVKYSDQTIIGARGFTEEEKEKGLILVFNSRNHKNLQWTEDGGIVAALGFGANNRIENCFIHNEDIVSVFSPDAKVKFDRWDIGDAKETPDESKRSREPEKEKSAEEKIISLDNFKKSKNLEV